MIGPKEITDPLIEGITVETDCSNVNDLPDVTITLDSVDYTLAPSDYVMDV